MAVPSKKVRNNLIQDLINYPEAFQRNEESSILDFLEKIWDLRSMPTTDGRYKDAYGDIRQHIVNNDDWDLKFLFLERLSILDASDDIFKTFLETIVNPIFRISEDDIFRYVLLINDHIDKEGLILAIQDYNDLELPIHKIMPKSDFEHAPSDLKRNTISFYVPRQVTGRSKYASSHSNPPKLPAFVLAFNDGWNDYSKMTSFDLFYYDSEGVGKHMGPLKIAIENAGLIVDMQDSILNVLPDSFTQLDPSFCSLGVSDAYYRNLKDTLKRDFESVLFAMRDIAFFPENREAFESNSILHGSLFRYEKDERRARQIRYQLYGYDLSNLYKFKYFYKPPYFDGVVDINLDFSGDGEIPSRIFALIGKNGTGKTQLISSLPLDISKKEDKLFSPRAPLFSKVIALSYSIFDRFQIPRKSSSFNYIYCGLRNEQGDIMTERGQNQRFHNTAKKIQRIGRLDAWRNSLLLFLDDETVNQMISVKENTETARIEYEISSTGITAVRKRLSSGQNILLNYVSDITANIMYDSLILFDEPETHLHPNAVNELINIIYELVNQYQSYCLLATHSPLVIRELFSKNVLVIERHENVPSIRRVGMESFGENLSVLTDEVFGNRDVPKHYKNIIDNLVKNGHTFEEIVEMLQTTGSPLSLNARIYLKSILS